MTYIPSQPGPDAPQTNRWLSLSDFSAGIQQKVMTPGVIQPSPGGLAAASIDNTYRCIALPSGGLGPLPSRYYTFTVPTAPTPPAQVVTNLYVASTIFKTPASWPAVLSPPHERDTSLFECYLFLSKEQPNSDGTVTHFLDVYDPIANLYHNLFTYTYSPPFPEYSPTYFAGGRAQPTSSSNTGENFMTGIPIVTASYCASDAEFIYALCFPNPIIPKNAAWGRYDYNVGASSVTPPAVGGHTHTYDIPGFLRNIDVFNDSTFGACGMVVSHQGRMVFFPDIWETDPQGGPDPPAASRMHNEAATWTFPNDLRQDGIQQWSGQGTVDGVGGSTISTTAYETTFGQENPVGIGVAASLNSSDLLLIKHAYGAYLVQGDLNAATVRRLPSVASTGGTRCEGANSTYGFIYGVNHGGVWAWGGGDGSELLSPQLEDDFWITPNSASINMYKGSFTTWENWVLCPNNWLFNGQGWWRIEDENVARWHVWRKNAVTNVLIGARDSTPGGMQNPPFADAWDKTRPSTSYSWQSHPMGSSADRTMEITDIIVTVQGRGKITLAFTDPTTAPVEEQITLPPQAAAGPVCVRQRTNFSAPYVTLRIIADSMASDPAPIVYQVQLGYNEGLPIEEANA